MLREVVRWSSIVSRHRGCPAPMAARSTRADEAGGIAAMGLRLARLFNPAIRSSYQLSGPAVREQLSGPAVLEQLSGPAVWEQQSGPAVWEQLSGPAVWEQLSGLAVWEQLSGLAVWEQLSGPAVWGAPGGLDNVSATTFSLPGMYLISAVNSAT
jgi:hypothetical protein